MTTPSPDTTPPSTPTGLVTSGVSQTSVMLSWNASSDNVGVTGYLLYLGGTQVGTSSSTSYLFFSGLVCGTSYALGVAAVDAAGNVSGIGTVNQQTSACSDTQPPSAPGTLSANAVSAGRVDLSWGSATDNVGVTGYHIERCQGAGCGSFTQIGTSTTTSYSDTATAAQHQLQLPRPRQRRHALTSAPTPTPRPQRRRHRPGRHPSPPTRSMKARVRP